MWRGWGEVWWGEYYLKQQSGKGVRQLTWVHSFQSRELWVHTVNVPAPMGSRLSTLSVNHVGSNVSFFNPVCYHLLGPVSLFSIFAKLCFGGEPGCTVVPYWLLFLLSLNVYFNSSITASATENQAWVECVFTSSTGEAQAGKSVWAPGQTNLHR